MSDESAYAGRWVARLRGKIIAQGGTPEEALRASRRTRHKESPEIIFMPASHASLDSLLDAILAVLPPGQPLYLVGGAVRDHLLQRPTHDLDFALPGDALRLGRKVANALGAAYYPMDEERGTARVILTGEGGTRIFLDFAAYRGADLAADLHGRDFSLNAIALDVRSRAFVDPLGGAADLHARLLRACSAASFSDDPVRILRAVRLSAALDLHIQPETLQAIRQAVPLLPGVSPERLRDELLRILEGPRPAACLRTLEVLGILPHLLPELPPLKDVKQPPPHVHDVWGHTLAVLDHLESILAALASEYDPDRAADLLNGLLVLRLGRYRQQVSAHLSAGLVPERSLRGLLFLAALYHDVGKPASASVDEAGSLHFYGHDRTGAEIAAGRAGAFHLSGGEIERLRVVIKNHMRFHFLTRHLVEENKPPTRRGIYRFFKAAGPAGVDLVMLGLADLRATRAHELAQETWAAALEVARTLLENWWEKPEESVTPPRLLNGDELMQALGLKPGPQIGLLLEAIREAQAMGRLSDRDGALEFARRWLADSQTQGERQ